LKRRFNEMNSDIHLEKKIAFALLWVNTSEKPS
jgi:hypothetical protein